MYDETIRNLRNESKYALPSQTKKALIEAADTIEQLSNAGSAYGRGWTLGYDAGRDENSPRWIPVTERLPKPNEKDPNGFAMPYLVMNGWTRVTARRTEDCWVLFSMGTVLTNVTHWMPLPQPPKEES